jgi:Uri superfamily endonuclease
VTAVTDDPFRVVFHQYPENMKNSLRESGAYILHLTLEQPLPLSGVAHFTGILPPGYYAYAGSARGPGGLAARIGRHLKTRKTMRWHIDRVTVKASGIVPLLAPGGFECALLGHLLALRGACVPVPGFGSSDCPHCPAHLVRLPSQLTAQKLLARLKKRIGPGARLSLLPASP